jgi:hypothetical protein
LGLADDNPFPVPPGLRRISYIVEIRELTSGRRGIRRANRTMLKATFGARYAEAWLALCRDDRASRTGRMTAMMKSPFSDPTPPNDLAVVGENKNDPSQLLLLGADGHYYAYSLPEGETEEVDPDDNWEVESTPSQELFT